MENKELELSNYYDGNRFWTGIATEQFRQTINFVVLLNTGLLAYLVDWHDSILRSEGDQTTPFLLNLAIWFTLLGVVSSLISMLSNLQSVRQTRNLVYNRALFYKEHGRPMDNDKYMKVDLNVFNMIWLFFGSLFRNDFYINETEFNKPGLNKKVEELRKRYLYLSKLSTLSLYTAISFIIIGLTVMKYIP